MRIPLLVLALGACGDDGGKLGDGGPLVDAALVDAPDLLNTPENVWTWIDTPGTACGNGTDAGFGINRLEGATKLLVYFEGGGACWDAATCFGSHTAVNIDITYDAAHFATDIGTGPVDRSPGNPFAAATLVWIPYCTGDLHAGAMTRDYGAAGTVHHAGHTNTRTFIEALHAKYPTLETIWLTGSSAGGYGATLNLGQFADRWSGTAVHLLQDSSPFVPPLANYATWQAAWSLQYPAGCTGCETQFPAVIDAVATAHPTSRIGLLTYDNDAVVKQYFGYAANVSLVPATSALVANQYGHANTRAFVLAGEAHTMLGGLGTIVSPSGVHLSDWVTQWATGAAAWATVTP